jgi:Rieske Fe-S protein
MSDYGKDMTDTNLETANDQSLLSRRNVLACGAVVVGAGLLSACGSSDASSTNGNKTPAPADSTGGQMGAAGGMQISTADVPVGGGKILDSPPVVLTQPTAGAFKAFSSICTHAGCAVSEVQQAQIICQCHGSIFSAVDGSVLQGPASSPLAPVNITVRGSTISVSG